MNCRVTLNQILLFLMISICSTASADNIGYTTSGSTSIVIGNNIGTNVYGSKYTSVNGGTLTTAYINGHNNWNGTDTVVILIYDDTGGYPHSLIAESAEIIINASSYTWWSASIAGTISASTDYWIFIRNKTIGTNSVRVHRDTNTISGFRRNDPSPTDDPFADGATTNDDSEFSMYISFTASGGGGGAKNYTRRRKICNMRENK